MVLFFGGSGEGTYTEIFDNRYQKDVRNADWASKTKVPADRLFPVPITESILTKSLYFTLFE